MLTFSLKQLLNYKKWLLILCCFSIFTTLIGLIVPYFTARFIDVVLIGQSIEHLRLFILLFCFIALFEIVSGYYSSVYSARIHAESTFRLSSTLLAHVQRLPLRFFQQTNSAYLAQRIQGDVDSLVAFALGNIINVFVSIFTFIVAGALLFSIAPLWLFLFLAASLVYGIIYYAFRKPLKNWSLREREAQNLYFSHITEQFRHIKSIKIHVLYEEFHALLKNSFGLLLDILLSRTKLSFWFSSAGRITQRIFILFFFLIGALQVIDAKLSIGNFVAINSYFSIALGSVSFFLGLGQSYQNANAAYQRIKELLEHPIEKEGTELPKVIESITVTALCFGQGETEILKNFSYQFKKGKVYCIIGNNGTGKTSLLYLLIGLLRAQSGSILFNDTPLENIDTALLRRSKIAFLEQEPVLIRISLKDNMLLGHGNETFLEMWIEKMGMDKFITSRDSSEFIIDDHLSVISGGEKQKIALLRAFAKDAPLLFLDEPLSALDEDGISRLIEAINQVKENRITIITTHKKEILAAADEIIQMNAIN